MKQNLTIFCCFHSLKITNMKFPVAIAETQANLLRQNCQSSSFNLQFIDLAHERTLVEKE